MSTEQIVGLVLVISAGITLFFLGYIIGTMDGEKKAIQTK